MAADGVQRTGGGGHVAVIMASGLGFRGVAEGRGSFGASNFESGSDQGLLAGDVGIVIMVGPRRWHQQGEGTNR